MKSRLIHALLAILLPVMSAMASSYTIYYDNSSTQWESVGIHYWGTPQTEWPGVEIDHVDGDIWAYTFPSAPSGVAGFLFKHATSTGDAFQTADFSKAPVAGHIYKGAGGEKGKLTDEGVYNGTPAPKTATVTASPKTGTRFSDEITVSLSVTPSVAIYYTTDGSTPTNASAVYSAPLKFNATTELRTLTITDEGVEKTQTFIYTRRETISPVDGILSTDYYRVNPDGKTGSNRTVDTKFTKHPNTNYQCTADNAFTNWTNDDLICQGVARDIASAFKGRHEYPVIDSYAIFAAYDSDNLYLGVQYVYAVWDEGGDGKSDNDRHRPWMMDGRIMLAFDLDPEKEFEGVLANGNTIWDADGKYNVMRNGTDCIWLGNTKPTVGVPALFFPDANGTTSYDAPYCVTFGSEPFYGVANGLLPCIEHIWGQNSLGYDPEELLTNDGFTDLIGEVARDKHTFYEWKFPLSKLGVTEQQIKERGIGVMVIDTYGQGAIGSTPYDPAVFDNANTSYSKDPSTSAEKEDMDIFTFKHARIGGKVSSAISELPADNSMETPAEYFTVDGLRVNMPTSGLYIVRRGDKVSKEIIR
ncbi:MAG: chitobiase/beta-hexosaminidase C-terminal domain-containing protein [Muribaculaceae bacterium]|nr:chitobiase/beta-hexosaminidase C-terminal domain-containing protein [Muribaculaceae bacterium]